MCIRCVIELLKSCGVNPQPPNTIRVEGKLLWKKIKVVKKIKIGTKTAEKCLGAGHGI